MTKESKEGGQSFEDWKRQKEEEERKRLARRPRRAKGTANRKMQDVVTRAQARKKDSETTSATIRHLQPNDWEMLHDLKIKSLDKEPIAFEDYESGMARYLSRTEEEWRKWLSNPNRVAVFAETEGEHVGMVSALVGDNTAYVQHMYVEESQRGKRISRDLLNTLLTESASKGAKRATLGVLETQAAAIELYKSFGFSITATHEVTRSGKIYNEILMEKVL